jgi:hypothetical protein
MQPAQYAVSAGCIRSLKPVVVIVPFAASVFKLLLIDQTYSNLLWISKNNFTERIVLK